MTTQEILQKAANAKSKLMTMVTSDKRKALESMAAAIKKDEATILEANMHDVEDARGNISDVMLDRLALNSARIDEMCEGIRNVAKLDDPVGEILSEKTLGNGLKMKKVSVPIGVVAIIYESRPNVTSDAAALCFMSGNVSVLRCGKEAYRTCKSIVDAMKKGLSSFTAQQGAENLESQQGAENLEAQFDARNLEASSGIETQATAADFINIIDDTSRESATEIMKARGLVDLLIPRGGAGLINACVEQAQVPVIETGTGICSVYVDKAADLDKAVKIIVNAKTQRPSVCNAEEQLLVHKEVAEEFLPLIKKILVDDANDIAGETNVTDNDATQSTSNINKGMHPVELRLDERTIRIIDGTPASDEDFDTEFLDYILAVKIVDSTQEACEHIEKHSTHHSEAIVTEDEQAAEYFVSHINSAALYVNASTRFTDGGMFGLGCEMGISTQKLHARGPMGLRELTSYKYIIVGDGQVR